jgi:4-amino-4-deoxy-L-arabinose transferase-like glycosyltransferase
MTADNASGRAGRTRRAFRLGLLGVFALFIILRWNNFNVPLDRDEGEYAYAAQLLKHGMAPYENSFLQKPPMIVYTYALADLVAPKTFWFPRVIAAIFMAGATVLLGVIARREFGPAVALPAMWLMTPLVLLPRIENFAANTEIFLMLPLMATVWIYVRSRRRPAKAMSWFWAGLFAAVTLLYKYTAFPILAFVFAMWTFEEWRPEKNMKSLALHWVCGALGGLVASLAILGFFLVRDGGRHFWECTIVFNHYYARSGYLGLTGAWLQLKQFLQTWWIIFLPLPFAWLVKRHPRIWFWGGMFLASCVSTAGSAFGHYYVLAMPFLAMLAAAGINSLAALSRRRAQWPRPLALRALTGMVLVFLCLPDASLVLCSKEQFADQRLHVWVPFIESKFVADRLAQLSSPNDPVYVAGSEPQILYYARRFSPTRFIIAYPLMIPTPLALGYQQEIIRDLRQHPPSFIVAARTPTSWMREEKTPGEFPDYLKNLLAQEYDVVGGYVYDAQGGHWQEPLSDVSNPQASLLLFKRKHP